MTTWESVGSTYLESITNALPLHRLVLFLFGFFGSVAVTSQTHLSIAETIIRVKLSDLTGFDAAILRDAAVSNVLFGVLAIFLGWVIARFLVIAIFKLAARSADLSARAASAIEESRKHISLALEEKRQEISILEVSLEKPRMRLRAMNAFSEILGGMAICCAVAAYWGNILDVSIGIICFFACIATSSLSVRTFFTEYYGTALFIAQLQGRKLPTPP